MSYKISQLSPHSTNAKSLRVVIETPSTDPPQGFRNMQFWRSWLEYDSKQPNQESSRSRLNWNVVLGLAAVVGISAGFWTGVGLLIARFVG